MHRLLRRLSLVLVVTSSLALLVGCGGLSSLTGLERLFPPGTFGSNSGTPFAGQFTLTQISVNGVNGSCPGSVTTGGVTYTCEAIQRAFLTNTTTSGTFTDTSPADQIGTGTWSLAGTQNSQLTITKNGVSTVGSVGFTADLSQFVYTVGSENFTWVKASS